MFQNKNSQIASRLILCSLLTFISSGCEISENAKRSAENSQRAADNSDLLKDLNLNAYGDGRQGAARDRREKALEHMRAADSLEAKTANAIAYYNALEFQLFKEDGFREDSEEKRNRLFLEAVGELIRVQKDFPKIDFETPEALKSLLAALQSNDAFSKSIKNGLALALGLHRVSERQREASVRYGFEPVSVLDLISKTLALAPQAESDPAFLSTLPLYQVELLKEKADTVSLLKSRGMTLLASSLSTLQARVTPSPDHSSATSTLNAIHARDLEEKILGALQSFKMIGYQPTSNPAVAEAVKACMGLIQLAATQPNVSTEGKVSAIKQVESRVLPLLKLL